MLTTLAEVEQLEREVDLSRRHLALIARGQRTIKKLLPALDVMRYPQLHAAERDRLAGLLETMAPAPPSASIEDAARALARALDHSTALLTVWTQEFLPLLLRHTQPRLRPPLRQLCDEATVLLAQTARARATTGGPA